LKPSAATTGSAALRGDHHARRPRILADARNSKLHTFSLHEEIRWLTTRVQAQLAIRGASSCWITGQTICRYGCSGHPRFVAVSQKPREPNCAPLTKGGVNAYAEISILQAHLDEMEVVRVARYAVKGFNRDSAAAKWRWIFPVPRRRELHTYLGLLTAARRRSKRPHSLVAYHKWRRARLSMARYTCLGEIYASGEKPAVTISCNFMTRIRPSALTIKYGGGCKPPPFAADVGQNSVVGNGPVRAAKAATSLRQHARTACYAIPASPTTELWVRTRGGLPAFPEKSRNRNCARNAQKGLFRGVLLVFWSHILFPKHCTAEGSKSGKTNLYASQHYK